MKVLIATNRVVPGVPKKRNRFKKFGHKLFQTKNLIMIFLEIYNNWNKFEIFFIILGDLVAEL